MGGGGRSTAAALVLIILFLELVLSGKAQEIWAALWSGPFPLGQGISQQARVPNGTVGQFASDLLKATKHSGDSSSSSSSGGIAGGIAGALGGS